MDELASLIGVKPDLAKMALKDPGLFRRCVTGPCLPYQFRLEGPHAWDGARDAIMGAHERVISALTPMTPPPDDRVRRGRVASVLDAIARCGVVIVLSFVMYLTI